jgi:repressor LexA
MLTGRLRKTLDAIITYQKQNGGVSPALTDISAALGLRGKTQACEMVQALEASGYIRRLPNRARAIEVLKQPRLPNRIPIYRSGDHKIMGYLPQ